VAAFAGVVLTTLDLFEIVLHVLAKLFFDCFVQVRLIALESDHVVSATLVNLPSDLFLATHGINRHDGPGKLQNLQ
jgi:hypothetical protein